jgi:hypothetical protein
MPLPACRWVWATTAPLTPSMCSRRLSTWQPAPVYVPRPVYYAPRRSTTLPRRSITARTTGIRASTRAGTRSTIAIIIENTSQTLQANLAPAHQPGPSFWAPSLDGCVAPSRVEIRPAPALPVVLVLARLLVLFWRGKGLRQQRLQPELIAQVRPHAFRPITAVAARRGALHESALAARCGIPLLPADTGRRCSGSPPPLGLPFFIAVFPLSVNSMRPPQRLHDGGAQRYPSEGVDRAVGPVVRGVGIWRRKKRTPRV